MTGAGSGAVRVIGGRYELLEEIGSGGGGIVHRARDRVTGGLVAVKSIRLDRPEMEPRVRREVAALRLLRIPGVVSLLDDVTESGVSHLVMDLVEGEPFPGPDRARTWDALAPRVRSILETLARIHAAGVVHRDLKPENVIVDRDGRVTILDFGVSLGTRLGPTLTRSGAIVGTPHYVAPEHLRGSTLDARADLHSLGIMIFEVLAGKLPHDAADFAALMARKLTDDAESLETAAPEAPQFVARTVQALLARDPDERPASANAVIHMLFAPERPDPESGLFPWIGPRNGVKHLVAAARAGQSLDVHGPRGTGRSRLLAEAAAALREAGRTVHYCTRGRAPFSSLEGAIGASAYRAAPSRKDAVREVESSLRAVLAQGAVILADDSEHMDRWSAEALDRCRDAGPVVRVVTSTRRAPREPSPGDVVTRAFEPSELEHLFAGPRRILHLPEDAAQEVWRRTAGVMRRVRSELSSWVRAGLAQWRGDRLVVPREALDRLRGGLPVGIEPPGPSGLGAVSPEFDDVLAWLVLAWPHATARQIAAASGRPAWIVDSILESLEEEGAARRLPDGRLLPLVSCDTLRRWTEEQRRTAHRALARSLPTPSVERLRHLIQGGEVKEAAAEGLEVAQRAFAEGRRGDAKVAAEQSLAAAHDMGDAEAVAAALETMSVLALSEGTVPAAQQVLYEIGRAPRTERIGKLVPLLEFSAVASDPRAAIDALAAAPPTDVPDLELGRQVVRARLSERLDLTENERVVESIEAWSRERGDARAHAFAQEARAGFLLRSGRAAEAADYFLAAAKGADSPQLRLLALLNAGTAFLEESRLDGAEDAARRALALAAEHRLAVSEAFAESLLRDVAHQRGTAVAADVELVDAVDALGQRDLTAWVSIKEAGVARKCGDRSAARRLGARARESAEAIGNLRVARVARALELACAESGERTDALEAEAAALVRDAVAAEVVADGMEVLALLATSPLSVRRTAKAALARLLGSGKEALAGTAGGLVTLDEAVAIASG